MYSCFNTNAKLLPLRNRQCKYRQDFPNAGEMELAIRAIQVNGEQTEEDEVVREHLVKSPSVAANRMLQVFTAFLSPQRKFNLRSINLSVVSHLARKAA